MEYKPLEEMMPKMKDLFENSFRTIEKEQNTGFIVCEDEKKNLAIGGVCKGDCYKGCTGDIFARTYEKNNLNRQYK